MAMEPASGVTAAHHMSRRPRLRDDLALFHPIPVVLTVLAAAAILVAAGSTSFRWDRDLAILLVVLTTQLAISVFNDICDRRWDAVAQPLRPLAAGTISARAAWAWTASLLLVGELLAFRLGWWSLVLVAMGTGLGLLYSLTFKRTRFSFVPFALAFPLLPVWELSLVRPDAVGLWTLFAVGIPAAIGIHLSDSIPDRAGDLLAGGGGLATRLSENAALVLSRLCLRAAGVVCLVLASETRVPAIGFASGAVALAFGVLPQRGSVGRYWVPVGTIVMAALWIVALTR